MNITLAQLETKESKQQNLEKILKIIKDQQSSDLIVFPEYCMGFPNEKLTRNYFIENSEYTDGEFVSSVVSQTSKRNITVILPIYEKTENSKIFNTALIIKEGNIKGKYRKIHMFDALGYKESNLFNKGQEAYLFNLGGFTFGVVICYDIRFPELIKSQVKAGAEVILVPAAWYRGLRKEEQWQTLLMARAHENTSYVVAVGNANEAFIGRSIVVDPFGIKNLDLGIGERVSIFQIDKTLIDDARRKLPVIKQSTRTSYTCKLLF